MAEEPRRRALVVSADPARARACTPILEGAGLRVHEVIRSSLAHGLVQQEHFRLVVLVDPVPMVHRLLDAIRAEGSRSRGAGVLFVADPEDLAQVRDLRVRPNQLVSLDRLHEDGRARIAALLAVAPRAEVGAWVRLGHRFAEEANRALCTTVNVSSSGMLLRGCGVAPVGTELAFELAASADDVPIAGIARVVRHAEPGREPDNAMAVTFTDVDPVSRARLERYVSRLVGSASRPEPTGQEAPAEADGSSGGEEPWTPDPAHATTASGGDLKAAAPPLSGDRGSAVPLVADASGRPADAVGSRSVAELERELAGIHSALAEPMVRGLQLRLRSPDWYLTGVELGLESLRDYYEISALVYRGDLAEGDVARHLAGLERVHRILSDFADPSRAADRRVMIMLEARRELERLLRELHGSAAPHAVEDHATTSLERLVRTIQRRFAHQVLLERLADDSAVLLSLGARLLPWRRRREAIRIHDQYRRVLRSMGYANADALLSAEMVRQLQREIAAITGSMTERLGAIHRRIYQGRFRQASSGDLQTDLGPARVTPVLRDVLRAGYEYLERACGVYQHALDRSPFHRRLLQRASELEAAVDGRRKSPSRAQARP